MFLEERNPRIAEREVCEVVTQAHGHLLRAKSAATDPFGALDRVVDKLEHRIEKLKGRVLNRERINKTIEGIYFICAECKKVCHNLDEGLVEDPNNASNLCTACAKDKGKTAA